MCIGQSGGAASQAQDMPNPGIGPIRYEPIAIPDAKPAPSEVPLPNVRNHGVGDAYYAPTDKPLSTKGMTPEERLAFSIAKGHL
jgi:hypothetical protein